jgi:hypothetical protein
LREERSSSGAKPAVAAGTQFEALVLGKGSLQLSANLIWMNRSYARQHCSTENNDRQFFCLQ